MVSKTPKNRCQQGVSGVMTPRTQGNEIPMWCPGHFSRCHDTWAQKSRRELDAPGCDFDEVYRCRINAKLASPHNSKVMVLGSGTAVRPMAAAAWYVFFQFWTKRVRSARSMLPSTLVHPRNLAPTALRNYSTPQWRKTAVAPSFI